MPVLTVFFGVSLKYAMGASIVSVIATSSGAAATYLRSRLSNLRAMERWLAADGEPAPGRQRGIAAASALAP